MCLIISKPANGTLLYDDFKTAIENNPDGFGLSFPDDTPGHLYTLRDANTPDPEDLFDMVQEKLNDVPVLLHLRYTTAGKTCLRNAHPFPILEAREDGVDLRMAHNGTISNFKKSGSDESDTRLFTRQIVRPLFKKLARGMMAEDILKDEQIKFMLSTMIPSSSVLTFLDGDGNTMEVNALGNGGYYDEDGVYYSNKYSFDPDHRLPYNYRSDYYQSSGGGYSSNTRYYGPKAGNSSTYKPHEKAEDKKTGTDLTVFDGGKKMKGKSPTPEDFFSDCNQETFTERWAISLSELFVLSDDDIQDIVENNPDDACQMIKELLKELQDARGE